MTNIKLEYDPDFDSTADQSTSVRTNNKNQSVTFDQLPSKTAFWAGVLTSLLGAGTIGFIVVLVLFLKGGDVVSPRVASANADSGRQVVQAPTPRPSLPPPSDVGDAITVREVNKDDHIRGNKNAKITLVEYSDLECPFCKRFHPTMQRLLQEYGGKIAWVYRHFPLRSLHSKAAKEAEATECASEQGKFWEYTDKIFEVTPSNDGLDPSQLPLLAEQVGLNRKKFEDCLSGGKYASHVNADEQDASAAGAQGTPYTVILTADGKKIPVSGALPFEQFKSLIDPLL